MSGFSRRQWFQQTAIGLAAVGAAGWTLRADAEPTEATDDAHDYQHFLNENGIPQVLPTETWEPTHEDILGPYYLPGAPYRGKVCPPLEPGETLVVRGRVWGFDTRKPLGNAVLDVWHADAEGKYDMTDPRDPPAWQEFKNRIRLVTDEVGYYEYETIRPAPYRVGQSVRPAHIHYLVQAPGYQKLITQVYFAGDPYIAKDRWASRSNLVVAPETVSVAAGKYMRTTFDVVLTKARE